MFLIFFGAGLIVSASLAYAGLVRGRLQFSKEQTWTGTKAKAAGTFALIISLALLGACGWLAWDIYKN
jgi:hypothetical protein